MKWFRKITFHKKVVEKDEDTFTMINDAGLINFVLERANYYNLKILGTDLNTFYCSSIELFGDKKSYLCFVQDFVKKFGNHIQDINF